MLAPSNSKFGPLGIREFEVFDLPYILPDLKTLRKVTEGPLGLRLLKLLDCKGITGLAYWDNGFKQMSANRKLVAPADYQGVKFRIQSSRVLQAQFKALGSLPAGDGVLGGLPGARRPAWSTARRTPGRTSTLQKMHEVQKYITETNHGYIGYVVIVNKKFWDDLPADIRDQLSKAMKEATDFNNAQSQKENDDALAEIKKSGKSEIIKLTAGAGRGDAQGDGAGLQGCRQAASASR